MDFNIVYDNFGSKCDDIVQIIKKAIELGYETIGLNTLISSDNLAEKNVKIPEPPEINVTAFKMTGGRRLKILNRLTAVIKDGINGHHLMQSPVTKKYDVIAVRPYGEKMLQHVCANLDVDIISIDLTEKLPYSFKRTYIGQAREKGIVFEIEYAPCLRDQSIRRWVISNAQLLGEVSKYQNFIVSSGALKPLELRGIHDVVNLCYIFGFNPCQAKAAVLKTGITILNHSSTHRKTGAGYVSVEDMFKLAKQDKWLVSACRIPRNTEEKSIISESNKKRQIEDDNKLPLPKKVKKTK